MNVDYTWLQMTWFILIGILLAGYAVLDGFDLGVGILHPLAKTDQERRIFLNAIGPIWDGNEVWLVTFGGALFAAFPFAYASIFSGFYSAFMLVLMSLIARAVSIELRGKMPSKIWKRVWDAGFFGSSLLATFIFGVAVGNAMLGLSIDELGNFQGTLFNLLRPYTIMTGLLAVSMFAMHGALYLTLKIPASPLHNRVRRWSWHAWGVFLVVYLLTTMYTLAVVKRAVSNFEHAPWAAAVVVLNVLAIANVPRALSRGRPGWAFVSSGVCILALVFLFSMALWPNLVTASNDPSHSLTIASSASSEKTLWIMLIVALIGMPLVLAYTATVYWTFRGKVEIKEGEVAY
ncbi:MAG TPA: cytochrome d ubiquinol oxidase subunit II [Phycisphaerae bacterium]|nr:cytochrome d ubiquinol oxidase subunit II [Phycisphaerae bacterium]